MEQQTDAKPKKRVWPLWTAGALALLAITATVAKLIGWPLGKAGAHHEKPSPPA